MPSVLSRLGLLQKGLTKIPFLMPCKTGQVITVKEKKTKSHCHPVKIKTECKLKLDFFSNSNTT